MTFWVKRALKPDTLHQTSAVPDVTTKSSLVEEHACGSVESNPSTSKTEDVGKYKTKVQDELKVDIDLIKSDMVGLYKRKDSGIITKNQDSELMEKKKKLDKLEKELSKKKKGTRKTAKNQVEKKRSIGQNMCRKP